jgi:hypothetical protein
MVTGKTVIQNKGAYWLLFFSLRHGTDSGFFTTTLSGFELPKD